jgi:hypothetical protein
MRLRMHFVLQNVLLPLAPYLFYYLLPDFITANARGTILRIFRRYDTKQVHVFGKHYTQRRLTVKLSLYKTGEAPRPLGGSGSHDF